MTAWQPEGAMPRPVPVRAAARVVYDVVNSWGQSIVLVRDHDRGTAVSYRERLLQRSPLIGREQEGEALASLLASPGVRLVSVTGVGGVGKTTLALQVANEFARKGVRVAVAELAAIDDPARMLAVIAGAMELTLTDDHDADPHAALAAFLDREPTLLVLDNLEHLEVAGLVHCLLAATMDVRILATSRTRLRLSEEWVFPLAPLPVPSIAADGQRSALDGLGENPSVRLLLDRFNQAGTPLAMTPANAGAITDLACWLEGIPLAIELAAGQGHLLSVAEILGQLRARRDVLRSQAVDRLGRHRAMEDSVRWSLDLLPEATRHGFCQLCVLRGTFDLETGLALGGLEVDDFVTLVDHGLVDALPASGDRAQFRILIPIREQGERLAEHRGVLPALRDRHAAHFFALAERADSHQAGTAEAFASLCRYEDEFFAALRWAIDDDGGDAVAAAARAAGAVYPFWRCLRVAPVGRECLSRILAALECDPTVPRPVRLRLMLTTGMMMHNTGDVDGAARLLDQTIADARGEGLDALYAEALLHRITSWRTLRRIDDAASLLDAARTAVERAGMPVLTAKLHFESAAIALHRGEYDEAETHICAAMEANRLLDAWRQYYGLPGLLGLAYLGRGQVDAARACYLRALRQPDVPEASRYATYEYLARLELHDHRPFVAAPILEECLRVQARRGSTTWIAAVLIDCAWLATLVDEDDRAIDLLSAAGADDPKAIDLLVQDEIDAVMRTLEARYGGVFRARLRVGLLLDRDAVIGETLTWLAGMSVPAIAAPTHVAGPHLTSREREVLALIAQGASNKEIAAALFIGTATVDTHVKAIFRKLDVPSRAAAVVAGLRLGVIASDAA